MAYVMFVEDQIRDSAKITGEQIEEVLGTIQGQQEPFPIVHASAEAALEKLGLKDLDESVGANQWPFPENPQQLAVDVRRKLENTPVPDEVKGICCDLEIPQKKSGRGCDVTVGKNLVRLLWHWREFHAPPGKPKPFKLVVCTSFDNHFKDIERFCDRRVSKKSL